MVTVELAVNLTHFAMAFVIGNGLIAFCTNPIQDGHLDIFGAARGWGRGAKRPPRPLLKSVTHILQ